MSADNGIYIAHFPDGYRVIHAQAIENLDYFPVGSQERKDEIKAYFGEVPTFDDEKEAILYAYRKSKDYDILEYGVCNLGELEAW